MAEGSPANDAAKKTKVYTGLLIDDSSDEEDSVEQYDIKEQMKKCKQSCNCKSSNILSFIGHALGIYILYSPPVQERYYELKEKKLKHGSTVDFLKESEIKKNIESELDNVKRYAGSEWKKEENNKEIMKNIFEGMKSVLTSRIKNERASYCRNYHKGPKYYLKPLLDKGLNPNDIPNFSRNFFLPCPFTANRETLENVNFDLSKVTQEHFPVEFLAHLRLHNRSEKRHRLNRAERYRLTGEEIQCKNASWRIFGAKLEKVVLCNENKGEYYVKYMCRNEKVYLNGWALTYSELFRRQDKTEFSTLLKNRLNIKKGLDGKCLSENILALWYLLFGCEVIRNPAAIIHNNMVLDLVEVLYVDEQSQLGYDYEKIIADMPMSALGIIKQAMELNKCYGYFMPYNYTYQYYASDTDAGELVEREANITKKWLEYQLGELGASYLITQCTSDNNAVQRIWDVIAESFEKWGISPKSIPHLEEDSVSQMQQLLEKLNIVG